MIFWNSMLVCLLVACQTASTDLSKAVKLEQQGKIVEAFDLYSKVIVEHPRTQHARNALRRVQRIHLKTAKDVERSNPARAVKLYQSILKKWPDSDFALIAQQKVELLQSEATDPVPLLDSVPSTDSVADEESSEEAGSIGKDVVYEDGVLEIETITPKITNDLIDEAELAACETARQSESRIVWQQYKQNFPDGMCIAEAEEFFAVVPPRIVEVEEAKVKALAAQKSLRKLCVEYRLSNTTSNSKACDNPSSALMSEFDRLQRRKVDLLQGEDPEKEEYYKKFVPPRWQKLTSMEEESCASLIDYVDNLARDGVDREAIRAELSFVETCFSDQGSID